MLSQIPNVSNVSAKAIIDKFKTFSNLIQCIEKDSACLNDILLYNKNGQSKNLSKPCINNIYEFLIKKTNITIDTL